MKRALMTIVGAAGVVAVAALLTGAASASGPGKKDLAVVVRDAEASVSPSDFFTATPKQNAHGTEDAPVYRRAEKVGLAETVYTVTRVAGDDVAIMVECSVELPEGNLVFNGTAHMADVATGATVPLVGGTGAYAGAIGTVTMIGAPDGSSTTLKFHLSK